MDAKVIVHGVYCSESEECNFLNELLNADGSERKFCERCGTRLVYQPEKIVRGHFRVELPRAKLPLLSSTAKRLSKISESEDEQQTAAKPMEPIHSMIKMCKAEAEAAAALLSLKTSKDGVKGEIEMEERSKG